MLATVRPLKRNEEQKLANRQSILTAGMLTFKDKGYPNTSVEDVIVRADVSRATFYKHFSNKFSLAEALVDEMVFRQDHAYDKLATIENPTQGDIVAWLETLYGIFSGNKILLSVLFELLGAEPNLREASSAANLRRIRKLAKSLSAFRERSPTDVGNAAAHDRALLLVTEIDTIFFRLSVSGWDIDRDVAIRFLAEQIQHFMAAKADLK